MGDFNAILIRYEGLSYRTLVNWSIPVNRTDLYRNTSAPLSRCCTANDTDTFEIRKALIQAIHSVDLRCTHAFPRLKTGRVEKAGKTIGNHG